MDREQSTHFQNIVDLDGGDEEGTCKRTDCWNLGAGVIPCWVFKPGSEHEGRCSVCDHLPECHEEDGQKQQDEYFESIGGPELARQMREQ